MLTARRVLLLGGARSGKSAEAERLAQGSGRPVSVIVTAEAGDAEMVARIALHRAARPAGWHTIEAPLELPAAIAGLAQDGIAIVDCLTLWLANIMAAERDVARETEALVAAMARTPCPIILVSNETGLGIVPATPLGRAFRDAQGRLNQRVAEACDGVALMVAGLPLALKPAPVPFVMART